LPIFIRNGGQIDGFIRLTSAVAHLTRARAAASGERGFSMPIDFALRRYGPVVGILEASMTELWV
jgi:hypothetical protein